MNLFIKLTAKLTRTDRYRPEVTWSRSWVYNIFRAFELVFGREYGVRREALASFDGSKVIYQFFTIESLLCHLEGEIRAWFRLPKFEKVEVWVPAFATANQTRRLPMKKVPYLFAIARDTSGNFNTSGASPFTIATYTVTGTNPFLIVGIQDGTNSTDDLTALSYAGSAMTQLQKNGSTRFKYTYYKNGPSTGSNSLSATFINGPISWQGVIASYSGVSQTGLDATNLTTDASCASNTHGVTPVATGCWAVTVETNPDGNPAAGSGANQVVSAQQAGVFDSNGTITAGANYNMTITVSGGTRLGMWSMFTIAPPATTNGNFFAFM